MRNVVFLMVFALVAGAGSATAAELVLNPVADSPLFGRSGYENSNYGSQSYGFWGFYYGGQRNLVRYDCSTVAGAVTKVELQFRLMQNNYGTGKMWACKVNAAWVENTVTWANQPAHDDTAATGRMLDIDWVSGLGPHRVACTTVANSIVQGWVSTPATNYGLVLKKNPETGEVPRCYPYQRESGTGVQLIVTYTVSVAPESLGKVKALFR